MSSAGEVDISPLRAPSQHLQVKGTRTIGYVINPKLNCVSHLTQGGPRSRGPGGGP